MQRLKLFGTAMMAILALTAIMATTASAKPEFLDPGFVGNTFTGKGPAGELTTLGGGIEIKCKENTVSGEVTGNETGTITKLDFKGCTALGLFKANSLGDAEGTILSDGLPFKLCYTDEAKKEVGLYIEKISTHIEVPSLGQLINVSGSIIGKITPVNTLTAGPYTITFAQSAAGDQNPVKCTLLGKELKASLVSSKDAKHETNESSAIVQKNEITFAKDIEIDA